MSDVQKKIEQRLERYVEHEDGWVCAATVLCPRLNKAMRMPEAPMELDGEDNPTTSFLSAYTPTADIIKKGKAFVKKVLDVGASSQVTEFLTGTGLFAEDLDEHQWRCKNRTAGEWWDVIDKTTSCRVASLARTLCSIPASTAGAERFFSTTGWMQGGRRYRLLAKKAFMLAVVHRALKPVKRVEEEDKWWDMEKVEKEKAVVDVDKDEPMQLEPNDDDENPWD